MENNNEEIKEFKNESDEKCFKGKVGFFERSPGNKSSMRLQSFFAMWMSFAFGMITILNKGSDSTTGLILTISFLIAAFAPKAIQSFSEDAGILGLLTRKK